MKNFNYNKYLEKTNFFIITLAFFALYMPSTARASDFVTPLDYYQLGQTKLENYFKKQSQKGTEPNLKKLIKKVEKSTVIINAKIGIPSRGESKTGILTPNDGIEVYRDRSTGIIINEGTQILTTAHSNDGNVLEIEVIGADKKVKKASIVQRLLHPGSKDNALQDWAVLELEEPFPRSMAVSFGRVQNNEILIMLGFSEHLGKTRNGRVVQTAIDKKKWYRPLGAIVRVQQLDGKTFFMDGIAGGLPKGGGSGGPLLNTKGELVGIYVSYLTEDSYKGRFYDYFDSVPLYTMRGMSVNSIVDQLLVLE